MNDIENFINIMNQKLNNDLITYIITRYIYKPYNIDIIKKQRKCFQNMKIQLMKFFRILHYDQNFIVYQNDDGNVILENNYVVSNIHLYSNTNTIEPIDEINEEYQQIANSVSNTSNNLIQSQYNTNQIILFNNNNNQVLDENGMLVPRRIHLSVVYI